MKTLYAFLLFVGYISVFASAAVFTFDFPSDSIIKIFAAIGTSGALLVTKTQHQLQRDLMQTGAVRAAEHRDT